jgi:hypothetical protein
MAEDIIARTTGPLHFRMILQPAAAIFFAVRDGFRDAKTGEPPWFWTMVTVRERRREMIRSGWRSDGRVFLIAIGLDVIYQFIVQRFVYFGEAVIVAFLLAIVPYVVLRGIITRLVTKFRAKG